MAGDTGRYEEQTQIMLRRRKPRSLEDLLRDSGFPYQVGKLVGAVIMTAHMLNLQEDKEVKAIGAKLEEVTSWFFEEAPK